MKKAWHRCQAFSSFIEVFLNRLMMEPFLYRFDDIHLKGGQVPGCSESQRRMSSRC